MDYYTESNRRYIFSYPELKEDFHRFKSMTDDEFIENALDILHFCCFVGYLKQLPSYTLLADDAIIHELVHLLVEQTKEEAIVRLPEIRELFDKVMELA